MFRVKFADKIFPVVGIKHDLIVFKGFYQGDFSLMTVFDDLKGFSKAGFDAFSRFLLLVLMIGGLTFAASRSATFVGEPSRVLLFIWALVGLFSAGGLLTVSAMPFAQDYIIFILLSLLLIGSIIIDWKVSQSG